MMMMMGMYLRYLSIFFYHFDPQKFDKCKHQQRNMNMFISLILIWKFMMTFDFRNIENSIFDNHLKLKALFVVFHTTVADKISRLITGIFSERFIINFVKKVEFKSNLPFKKVDRKQTVELSAKIRKCQISNQNFWCGIWTCNCQDCGSVFEFNTPPITFLSQTFLFILTRLQETLKNRGKSSHLRIIQRSNFR